MAILEVLPGLGAPILIDIRLIYHRPREPSHPHPEQGVDLVVGGGL